MRFPLLICSLVLGACSGDGGDSETPNTGGRVPVAKLALKNFSAGCGDFLSYAADALTEQYLQPFRCFGFGPCPIFETVGGAPPPAATPTPTSPAADSANPTRGSDTNTQEAGVDEADIVKRDGGRLYILSGRTLNVLQAFPPAGLESRPLGTLALAAGDDSFYGRDFFLDAANARLVVLGERYNGARSEAVSLIVDISNPAAPALVTTLGVQGAGLEARRVGSRVHRVSRFDVPPPAWFFDSNEPLVQKRQDYHNALGRGDQAAADAIKAEVRSTIGQRVTQSGADGLLPKLTVQNAGASVVETTLPCSAIAHPEVTTGMGIALIDSFNTGGAQRATSGVINNAYVVYGSAENLYLAQSSAGWFFAPQQADQTAIYKLALSESGAASYQGVGSVDGSILGSYALSEHAGDLRVASTLNGFGGNIDSRRSQVVVLRASGGTLAEIGAVRDLAPGESIQGVRFIGERGYVVTFRNKDPLFALDLSSPAAPRVTNELKIPGFSSYLLPLGDTHLLTIGRAGDEENLNGQLAIQLFDVRDPANTVPVASLSPDLPGNGGSYSAAEYDPHAFTYFPDSESSPFPGTLSVPLHAYDHNSGEAFAGFLVVRVDPAATPALRESGRIDHKSFTQPGSGCGGGGSAQTFAPCRDAYYAADPRRSVFMQDAQGTYLFTISALGVLASDALAPSTQLGRKPLPFDEPPCCVVFPADGGGTTAASPG